MKLQKCGLCSRYFHGKCQQAASKAILRGISSSTMVDDETTFLSAHLVQFVQRLGSLDRDQVLGSCSSILEEVIRNESYDLLCSWCTCLLENPTDSTNP